MTDRGSVRKAEVVSLYEILRSRRRATVALRILAALAVAFAHLDASLGLGEAIGVSLPRTELATLGLIVFLLSREPCLASPQQIRVWGSSPRSDS